MKITILKCAAAALVGSGVSFAIAQTSQPESAPASTATQIHSISLPQLPPPTFPEGRGRDAFMVQCGICHSQRYVTMQPPFSRKVWTDEVNKMVATYKALVPADQVPEIVDYLVFVRGNGK